MKEKSRSARDLLRVKPRNGRVSLADIDPGQTHGVKRKKAEKKVVEWEDTVLELQERLHAEAKRSLLIILQGMDTSGKDGTIRHALRGLNPQGVRIVAFKQPTPAEKRHDFLWRIRRGLPAAGMVGIFNRSHYEDVLIARVKNLAPPEVIDTRYDVINKFEEELAKAGTSLLKICLHISYEEQRTRLLDRLHDPGKHYKFTSNDVDERAFWDEYAAAYDTMLSRCSTRAAPWYVVPSDDKSYRNYAVSRLLIETLEEMDPQYPRVKLDVRGLEKRLQPVE